MIVVNYTFLLSGHLLFLQHFLLVVAFGIKILAWEGFYS
jgi:hypothetical protein